MVGLGHRKGDLKPGMDADLVVWDPNTEIEVNPPHIQHRHKLTPYLHRRFFGKVERTYVRGQRVYDAGVIADGAFGQSLMGSRSRV